MSTLYRKNFRKSNPRRAKFARAMMLQEFGYRFGRAIQYDDFHDRQPHERPLRLHEIGAR